MTNVLGLSGGIQIGNQDGAAALLQNGQLIAAAEEERFVGIKFANGQLPRNAIHYCLGQAGIGIAEVDAVVFAGATYERFEEILQDFFQYNFGHAPPVQLVDHHLAHAASAYYGSGWPECLVLTMDASGDRMSTTIRTGQGGELQLLDSYAKPDSLGLYYSMITQFLGFQRDSDEYKVMGMAAYGQPHIDMSPLLKIADGGYQLQTRWLRGLAPDRPGPSKQERLFTELPLPCPPRIPGAPIEQVHYDVAASAQHQLEQVVVGMVRHYTKQTGQGRVALAGGVALNCLMNQKIRELPEVDAIYVPPVCSDAGLALGGAYLVSKPDGAALSPLSHAYLGPGWTENEIRETLVRTGATFVEVSDPVAATCDRIAAGNIVGWFQGRMEYGPRALGNRSIVADPARASLKDEINSRVKFREEFRPLAPAVLHEDGPQWFDGYCDSPFMTQTFTAGPQAIGQVPATVHADGTSRLQSVHRQTNALFAELLTQWKQQSGRSILLNTSLNAYNDPIACQPYQALRTFFATGLDSLVLGPFVLDKKGWGLRVEG